MVCCAARRFKSSSSSPSTPARKSSGRRALAILCESREDSAHLFRNPLHPLPPPHRLSPRLPHQGNGQRRGVYVYAIGEFSTWCAQWRENLSCLIFDLRLLPLLLPLPLPPPPPLHRRNLSERPLPPPQQPVQARPA